MGKTLVNASILYNILEKKRRGVKKRKGGSRSYESPFQRMEKEKAWRYNNA